MGGAEDAEIAACWWGATFEQITSFPSSCLNGNLIVSIHCCCWGRGRRIRCLAEGSVLGIGSRSLKAACVAGVVAAVDVYWVNRLMRSATRFFLEKPSKTPGNLHNNQPTLEIWLQPQYLPWFCLWQGFWCQHFLWFGWACSFFLLVGYPVQYSRDGKFQFFILAPIPSPFDIPISTAFLHIFFYCIWKNCSTWLNYYSNFPPGLFFAYGSYIPWGTCTSVCWRPNNVIAESTFTTNARARRGEGVYKATKHEAPPRDLFLRICPTRNEHARWEVK